MQHPVQFFRRWRPAFRFRRWISLRKLQLARSYFPPITKYKTTLIFNSKLRRHRLTWCLQSGSFGFAKGKLLADDNLTLRL
jgi:hypothetical protein